MDNKDFYFNVYDTITPKSFLIYINENNKYIKLSEIKSIYNKIKNIK